VSPESGSWFFDLVAGLAKKYNVTVPIERSALSFLIDKAKNNKQTTPYL
jgi:hypothetical protein